MQKQKPAAKHRGTADFKHQARLCCQIHSAQTSASSRKSTQSQHSHNANWAYDGWVEVCMLIKEVIVHEGLFDAPTAAAANKLKPQPKPIPEPVSAADIEAAEANAKKQKLRRMAAVMQAKRLNAARTQMTTDELAMAFRLASS